MTAPTGEPPAGPEDAPRPGPAGPACPTTGRAGTRPLYIRHRFDDTRPTGYPPTGLCTALDDDGQMCGRPYGEHLT